MQQMPYSTWPKILAGRIRISESALLLLGVLFGVFYPGIGLSASWVLGLNEVPLIRRGLQAAVLCLGISFILAYSLRVANRRALGMVAIASAFLFLTFVFWALLLTAPSRGLQGLSTESLTLLLMGSLLFVAASLSLVVASTKCVPCQKPSPVLEEDNQIRLSPFVVYTLSGLAVFLLLMVVFRGASPSSEDAHLSMGGHPTILGVFFLFTFIFMNFGGGGCRLLISCPWLALALYTTSRVVYLLFALTILVQIGLAFCHLIKGHIKKRLASRVTWATLGVCLAVGLVSLGPRVGLFQIRDSIMDELLSRMSRIARPLGLQGLLSYENAPDAVVLASTVEDDRWQIYTSALYDTVTSPLGRWPNPWSTHTQTTFANGVTVVEQYSYPHNVFAEMALQFGIPVGLVFLFGIGTSLLLALHKALHASNLASFAVAAAFAIELMRSQFNGAITDSAGLVLLCFAVAIMTIATDSDDRTSDAKPQTNKASGLTA